MTKTISISLGESEIKGIIGANGIGKTTLIKKLHAESKTPVVMLGQGPLKTLSHLTVNDVITSLRQDFASSVDETLLKEFGFFEQFKFEKFLRTAVVKLSGGENQILKIYSAFMIKSNQYFLDEPTSFLDTEKKECLAKLIKFYQMKGKSFLIIEHDLSYLKNLTTDLLHLE